MRSTEDTLARVRALMRREQQENRAPGVLVVGEEDLYALEGVARYSSVEVYDLRSGIVGILMGLKVWYQPGRTEMVVLSQEYVDVLPRRALVWRDV